MGTPRSTPTVLLRPEKIDEFKACVKEFIINDEPFDFFMKTIEKLVGDLSTLDMTIRIPITTDFMN